MIRDIEVTFRLQVWARMERLLFVPRLLFYCFASFFLLILDFQKKKLCLVLSVDIIYLPLSYSNECKKDVSI